MKNKRFILQIIIIFIILIIFLNVYYVNRIEFVSSELKLELTSETEINDTLTAENKSIYDEIITSKETIENQNELLRISEGKINILIDSNDELEENIRELTKNLNELTNTTNFSIVNIDLRDDQDETMTSKKTFLNKALKRKREEIEQHVFEKLMREDCLRILNGSIDVANNMYGNYSTLGYDFNKTTYEYDSNPIIEDYHLVSDMTYRGLKNYINAYFTFQVTETIINENVSFDGESEDKLYRVYKEKVFTLGGEGGSSPVHTTYFEDSIFELLEYDISEKNATYRVHIPSVIDATDKYEIYFRTKEIEFKYENDKWKVNTVVKRLGFY